MYEEGLGKKWEARKAYWKNPTDELRQQFASAYALESHHTEIAKLMIDFLHQLYPVLSQPLSKGLQTCQQYSTRSQCQG